MNTITPLITGTRSLLTTCMMGFLIFSGKSPSRWSPCFKAWVCQAAQEIDIQLVAAALKELVNQAHALYAVDVIQLFEQQMNELDLQVVISPRPIDGNLSRRCNADYHTHFIEQSNRVIRAYNENQFLASKLCG